MLDFRRLECSAAMAQRMTSAQNPSPANFMSSNSSGSFLACLDPGNLDTCQTHLHERTLRSEVHGELRAAPEHMLNVPIIITFIRERMLVI